MAVRTTLGIALAAGLLATAGTAVAAVGDAGPAVFAEPALTVKGLIGHGGACSADKPKLVGVADNVVAVAMPAMTVRVGQVDSGEHVAEARSTCSLSFRVVVPAGQTALLRQATYHGVAELTAGATAVSEINYLLPGNAGAYVTTRRPFTGPTAGPWSYSDEVAAPAGKAQGQSVSLDVALSARAGAGDPGASVLRWATDAGGATMYLRFTVQPARQG
ncbi:hypothetical protein GCM10010124_23030 [Pilimelia terevasa]|uniref:DUF4360 domain-containing protein n=1 Tax=Pilimelia terevasa TaxID=53372 RepID=A0A8J3BPV6_9ACTN|nr:DUF4360 domain-containing protein [Pilimelia terevasa]GGK29693.1 hypothetical protein GCM10010124_23030 [Pilimelia terevasa]